MKAIGCFQRYSVSYIKVVVICTVFTPQNELWDFEIKFLPALVCTSYRSDTTIETLAKKNVCKENKIILLLPK